MLVTLYQYKHEEVQFDDNRTTGESQTEDSVETDAESYFGDDLDQEHTTWETVEYEGDPIQRRELSFEQVTALSAPTDEIDSAATDDDADDEALPGSTYQVRIGGDSEYVANTVLVEAQDPDP